LALRRCLPSRDVAFADKGNIHLAMEGAPEHAYVRPLLPLSVGRWMAPSRGSQRLFRAVSGCFAMKNSSSYNRHGAIMLEAVP
jgi:hypothetical protein